ncbi:acyl-CoA dehydrogenase [Sphingopyxis sp. PAMC25046]|uniref:acyl-CoA dehydrogenase n=1 Tax=Sphingopyxis sp. PAMC25046 TaxID=2565556 RepID=UPI00109DB497|nr:acyl-CoA dehydrogenase [Sphingopyxis sp. PAMC25046]QCB54690.1 acyl-CoA dehydrogenase [Sphingopyxis sp. PAMC25046]
MTFFPPIAEQRFVLDHVARIDDLVNSDRFSDLDRDLVGAILAGAGELAADVWAPTNRTGDRSPPQWTAGEVTMPHGFKNAYCAYVEGGWGSISAPKAFGGQGLPAVLGFAVAENLGTANMGFNLCPMLTGGAIEAIAAHGSPDLQQQYLPKLITGEWTGTMNLTEPQAGSDVGAVRTMATPTADGGWMVKGTKIFITFGEHDLAENIVHLVLARTPNAPSGTKGLSLFLVPKIRPDGSRNDVRCASIEHKLGIHSSPTCVMTFGDNDVCDAWLIGPEGAGMRAMFTMMNNARLNVGLQGVEIAERATQQAFAYARERTQSSLASDSGRGPVAIIEHPDVRRMLMRMTSQTQAIRALVYAAAAEIDRAHLGLDGAQKRLDLLTPLAKSHATDIGCQVASLGIQVHGGMGFIEETGAAQHYRDARIAPIYEGTNGIQAADLVGRKLMNDHGEGIRSLIADVRAEARSPEVLDLVSNVDQLTDHLLAASISDRLAASSPYLTMVSVMTCGWLIERQITALDHDARFDSSFRSLKLSAGRYYLSDIVPEVAGLRAAVRNGEKYLHF